MVFDVHLGLALVDDGVKRDVAGIGADVGDLGAIRAPPEAVVAVELFLGDEFGEAVGKAVLRAGGELAGLAAGDGRDEEFALTDESNLRAVAAEAGVDRALGGVEFAERSAANTEVEAAAARHEKGRLNGFFRPLVIGDAEFTEAGAFAAQLFLSRKLALGGGRGRGTGEYRADATGDVVTPEAANEVAVFAEEVGDGGRIGGEAEAAGDDRAGSRHAGDIAEGDRFERAAHEASASLRKASISAIALGSAAVRTSAPESVTRMSSSMRMPPEPQRESTSGQLTASANVSRRAGSVRRASMK